MNSSIEWMENRKSSKRGFGFLPWIAWNLIQILNITIEWIVLNCIIFFYWDRDSSDGSDGSDGWHR